MKLKVYLDEPNSLLPHLWIEIKLSWLVGKLGNGVLDSRVFIIVNQEHFGNVFTCFFSNFTGLTAFLEHPRKGADQFWNFSFLLSRHKIK